MFKVKINDECYNFEKFSYVKSYDDYSRIIIDDLYTIEGGDGDDSPAAGIFDGPLPEPEKKHINPSSEIPKGTPVKVELVFNMDKFSVKKATEFKTTMNTTSTNWKNGKKTGGANNSNSTSKTKFTEKEIYGGAENETVMVFNGVVQSISVNFDISKPGAAEKVVYGLTITDDFAGMSNTTNEAFDIPAEAKENNNGPDPRLISKVVSGATEKYLSKSGVYSSSNHQFAKASTSSAIISTSDTKNMAYDISREYGFSIYDTQRPEKSTKVEIKRVGYMNEPVKKVTYELTMPDKESGKAILMLDAVRQIARNKVVYDGVSSINPINYYKDLMQENAGNRNDDEAPKRRGKAMYPLNMNQNPDDGADPNRPAELAMADPYEYSEDDDDAKKKVLGRKDYKIFERSEYEMTFTSVPAISVKVLSDEENRNIDKEIDKLRSEMGGGRYRTLRDMDKIAMQNFGCGACTKKYELTCAGFTSKTHLEVDETYDDMISRSKNQPAGDKKKIQFMKMKIDTLGDCAVFSDAELQKLPEFSAKRHECEGVNSILLSIYDFLADSEDTPKSFTSRNSDEWGSDGRRKKKPLTSSQSKLLEKIVKFGRYGHEGWNCLQRCRHSPKVDPIMYVTTLGLDWERYNRLSPDQKKRKADDARGGFNPLENYWSPFGQRPSVAFCNNMNNQQQCRISSAGCEIYKKSVGQGVYNIFKHRGPREASLYAYLASVPNVYNFCFEYKPQGYSKMKKFHQSITAGDTVYTVAKRHDSSVTASSNFESAFGKWLIDKANKKSAAGDGWLICRPEMLMLINPETLKDDDSVNLLDHFNENSSYIRNVRGWLMSSSYEIGIPYVSNSQSGQGDQDTYAPVQCGQNGEFHYDDPDNVEKFGSSNWNVFPLKFFDNLYSSDVESPLAGNSKLHYPIVGWTGKANGRSWERDRFFLHKGRYYTYHNDYDFPVGDRKVQSRGGANNADHPFNRYTDKNAYSKDAGTSRWPDRCPENEDGLVLFSHEKIAPNAFDGLLSDEVAKKNELGKIIDDGERKRQIEELKKKKGGVEAKNNIKIEAFLDKFPLDYISFKNAEDVRTFAPVNNQDYILKTIKTTITNSKKEQEDLKNRMLKAVFGDKAKDVVQDDDKAYRIKGSKNGKAFFSDFSGVSTTLTVAPASEAAKGEFVSGADIKMGIGDYEGKS